MTSQSTFYLLDPRHKPSDNKWHYIKNVHFKQPDGWHQHWNYKYAISDWSKCTTYCGGGEQNRTVKCTRSDGLDRPTIFCTNEVPPLTHQTCNTHPCFYMSSPWVKPGRDHGWYSGYFYATITNDPITWFYDFACRASDGGYGSGLYIDGIYTVASGAGRKDSQSSNVGRLVIPPASRYPHLASFQVRLVGHDNCCEGLEFYYVKSTPELFTYASITGGSENAVLYHTLDLR